MERPWRRPLSQNFLTDRGLVSRLVRATTISPGDEHTPGDLVVEIGPGRGILTAELLQRAGRVVAIEIDGRLCAQLRRRFAGQPRLQLIHGDFLSTPLPRGPWKVFASIPYAATSDIVRRLLEASNPPDDCWLVVQAEAAGKLVPQPRGNRLAALLYYPWWRASIVHRFRRSDFRPPPRVDSVLLRLERRAEPLVPGGQQRLYQDYAAFSFGRDRAAPELSADAFVAAFKARAGRPRRLRAAQGAYSKLRREQASLEKIHRTRRDRGWRKYAEKKSSAPKA
jgi:23S rRNA (adenine-N6)-dimethyltransferase